MHLLHTNCEFCRQGIHLRSPTNMTTNEDDKGMLCIPYLNKPSYGMSTIFHSLPFSAHLSMPEGFAMWADLRNEEFDVA